LDTAIASTSTLSLHDALPISMTLNLPRGKQARSILEANARINIWHGSVRSGKTVASILRWLDFVAHGPPGELLMVGKTTRTLKRDRKSTRLNSSHVKISYAVF